VHANLFDMIYTVDGDAGVSEEKVERKADERLGGEVVTVKALEEGHNSGKALPDSEWHFTAEDIEDFVVDPAVEKSLLRKLDSRILILVFAMYLFSALDRVSVSCCQADSHLTDIDDNVLQRETWEMQKRTA
jgi:hypothetical protein